MLRNVLLVASLAAPVLAAAVTPPHLSQAWQAESTGDGEPGETGLESYIYEDCKEKSDTCMSGHVFNYGASCVKYEVNRGFHSPYSGTFYVNCDAVDCCVSASTAHDVPNVKKWDIGAASKLLGDKVTYLGKQDTTELNGNPVHGADAWNEIFNLPFTKIKVNYTYYVTVNGTDVTTHRIDYSTPGDPKAQSGSILYGNFKVQHDLDTFRDVFKSPDICHKPNTLRCSQQKVEEWERKYFSRHAQHSR